MSKNRRVKRSSSAPKKKSRSTSRTSTSVESPRNREVVGIIGLGAAIFVMAALLSLQGGQGTLMGPFGRAIASTVYGLAGMCSYLLAGVLVVVAVRLLMQKPAIGAPMVVLGGGLGVLSLSTLFHLIGGSYRVAGHATGGLLGEHLGEVLRAVISTPGTALVAMTGLVCAVVVATPLRMRTVLTTIATAGLWVWAQLQRVGTRIAAFGGEVIRAILPERDRDEYYDGAAAFEDDYDEFEIDEEGGDPAFVDPPIVDTRSAPIEVMAGDTDRVDESEDEEEEDEEAATAKKAKKSKKAAKKKSKKKTEKTKTVADETDEADEADEAETAQKKKKKKKSGKAKKKAAVAEEPIEVDDDQVIEESAAEPLIVASKFSHVDAKEMKAREEEVDANRLDFIPLGDGAYQLPPIHLLDFDESTAGELDRSAMLELSAKLTKTLESYGVKGEVVAIRPGPVVTMYEFSPAAGTRINKIVNLSDDLAMSLEALRVRIVAPIPGKAAVGIEVPNRTRETVYLKEILAHEGFQNNKVKLPLALGKDIEGGPTVVDLAKMPHLLVAGTTGSGKSVSVNSMIASLLYHCSPEDVRMIMVDPKMLELSIYEGIPHLLLPVVTDPKKANLALRWAVDEMERRYGLLAGAGVRDLGSYNGRMDKMHARWDADRLRLIAEEAERIAEQDEEVEVTEDRGMPLPGLGEEPKRLPYIVIVIDEFADLMMCAAKEVETSVARIAQKARAAGIHLILATQRPSVDVITGLIKANFPSRAAFRVTSKVDSRTILDGPGAEALLGAGDMLFSDRGAAPQRLHGCFVDEEELIRVVDFLKTQGRPVYDLDIIKPREESGGGESSDEPVDEMYDRAVAIVAETKQVSISMIQRKLRIGYNRAARIVEHMETQGIVSPPDGTNRREVLLAA